MNDNKPQPSPLFINKEIETIHNKISHLKKTNEEIRNLYMHDSDCMQALNENIIIINWNVHQLLLHFKMHKSMIGTDHPLIKYYMNYIQMQEQKQNSNNFYDEEKVERKRSTKSVSFANDRVLKEFDLDYVAQRLRINAEKWNAKQELMNGKSKQKQKENNSCVSSVSEIDSMEVDCNEFTVEDDGGITL